jgi:hypothetical protein
MSENPPNLKPGWPLLQYRDGSKTVTAGQVHPFNNDGHIKPGTREYSLYGIPVVLVWSYDTVGKVIAPSRDVAENILTHFGPRQVK